LWKGQERQRSAAYDCERCDELGFVEEGKRICFQIDPEDPVPLLVPIVVNGRASAEADLVEVRDQNEMLTLLCQLKESLPEVPVFILVLTYFKRVCPASLIKWNLLGFLDMEHRAREFHKLPYPGEMGDQPNVVVEAFDTIGVARSEWERDRIEKMQREVKAKVNQDRRSAQQM